MTPEFNGCQLRGSNPARIFGDIFWGLGERTGLSLQPFEPVVDGFKVIFCEANANPTHVAQFALFVLIGQEERTESVSIRTGDPTDYYTFGFAGDRLLRFKRVCRRDRIIS
tara:strand:+ start:168 stop:500 length:333 start_codon:yes stop_codon:yes gene_type:complete